MNRAQGLGAIALSFVSACAAIDPKAGFDDVQRTLTQRTGQRLPESDASAPAKAIEAARMVLAEPLTADRALAVAFLANRRLRATLLDLGVAQADLVEAGLLPNPRLTAEVRFPSNPRLPFEVDVVGDLLAIVFRPLRQQAAAAEFEAARARVTQLTLDLASEVEHAFVELQASEQLRELRGTVRDAMEASVEGAARLRRAGNVTKLALANQRALLEEARLALAAAEADVSQRREDLNRLLGVWGRDTAWTLAEPRLPDPPDEEISREGLESFAISERVDLAALRHEIEGLSQGRELAGYLSWLEEGRGETHLEGEPDGRATVGPGIEVPLPLFHQGQPARARADARLRQALESFAAEAVEIRAEVRAARDGLFAARAQAQHRKLVVLPLREEIVDETLRQYYAMQAGLFELLAAKREQIEAGASYVEGLREYWTARLELKAALGGRFPERREPR